MERRHAGHGDMEMAGMDASTTMAMSMASATASSVMSMATGMDMDMGGMSEMHMYFTTQFKDYPVLFKGLTASNKGQAFGIFVLLFFVAFVARGLEFVRLYLEQKVWKNPNYINNFEQQPKIPGFLGNETSQSHDSIQKSDSIGLHSHQVESDVSSYSSTTLPIASRFFRDILRLALCILPDLLGYSLMLAAMSYTLTYFFAVVVGSGVGRFYFEKLSGKHNLRSGGFSSHC
ncbi:copper transport protein [Scheffersomyces coipomensis]|uniref:copper transport protein n=1 Tax=Scheffersomyces coipomensis TaxID=1788519 RepID=UPI00315D9091